jgi:hypothetical protein
MSEHDEERDAEEVDPELDDQSGELLPDREAMSVLTPQPLPPVDPDGDLILPSEPGIGDPAPN